MGLSVRRAQCGAGHIIFAVVNKAIMLTFSVVSTSGKSRPQGCMYSDRRRFV